MQKRTELTDEPPITNWTENEKDRLRERRRLADWPELDRKMAIIARMTSDPPAQPSNE